LCNGWAGTHSFFRLEVRILKPFHWTAGFIGENYLTNSLFQQILIELHPVPSRAKCWGNAVDIR
jgi:hypothetical protein